MNKIMEAVYKSHFPKLKVEITKLKHKRTGEIKFCVMGVSSGLVPTKHMFVYDASEWDELESTDLEGTGRIQECFHQDLLKQMDDHNLRRDT